jgi:hypothetical protein
LERQEEERLSEWERGKKKEEGNGLLMKR